jgi:hypothetical protein
VIKMLFFSLNTFILINFLKRYGFIKKHKFSTALKRTIIRILLNAQFYFVSLKTTTSLAGTSIKKLVFVVPIILFSHKFLMEYSPEKSLMFI